MSVEDLAKLADEQKRYQSQLESLNKNIEMLTVMKFKTQGIIEYIDQQFKMGQQKAAEAPKPEEPKAIETPEEKPPE